MIPIIFYNTYFQFSDLIYQNKQFFAVKQNKKEMEDFDQIMN
jgi:hypothetical protein